MLYNINDVRINAFNTNLLKGCGLSEKQTSKQQQTKLYLLPTVTYFLIL
jgi:hypothetical protein